MIPYCSICWDIDKVKLLDQRKLPREEIYLDIRDYREVIEAIKTLAIRGAPAIGVAPAMLKEDETTNRRMGQAGQVVITEGMRVLTHCNTGALATGAYGTALGV